MLRRPYAAVAGLLQLPLQLIAIHRLDGDFTGAGPWPCFPRQYLLQCHVLLSLSFRHIVRYFVMQLCLCPAARHLAPFLSDC